MIQKTYTRLHYTCNGRSIENRIWSIERRHFQWPWTTPTSSFKVTLFFDAEYITNGTTYRHSFNEILVGTYTRPTVLFRMTLSALEWLSKIFNDTKRRAVSLRQPERAKQFSRSTLIWQRVPNWRGADAEGFCRDILNGSIFNDLERPLPTVSRSRHSLTLNISETVRHTDSVIEILIGTYTRPTQQCHFEWPWVTEWLSKIFNDTKRRAVSLQQLSFLYY